MVPQFTDPYIRTVMDVVEQADSGILVVNRRPRLDDIDPQVVVSLLDSMWRGWAGPLILAVIRVGRYEVVDGALRVELWRQVFKQPAADAPQWLQDLGVVGLADPAGPRFTFDDHSGARQIAPWQLARPAALLAWQTALRASGTPHVDHLLDHAKKVAARLAQCRVPMIMIPLDGDVDHVRTLVNSRLAEG